MLYGVGLTTSGCSPQRRRESAWRWEPGRGTLGEWRSVERSAAAIRGALAQSGHPDFTIQVLDHDDHGMRDASGSVDPRYLDAMRNWLSARVPAPR
jgi:hypothetical protein